MVHTTGVKFDSPTCRGWILTSVLALLVDAVLQQPMVLMVTAVLGDFVEQSSSIIIEMIQDII
jgi:hypothetical protein